MVLGMSDRKILLENFEAAGHYGYGRLKEGLCCLPGCVVDKEQCLTCARCLSISGCTIHFIRTSVVALKQAIVVKKRSDLATVGISIKINL
jgi:hypothetical protein